MNKKLRQQISEFRELVGLYIRNEYKPKYYKIYILYDRSISHIVESYYLGGSTIPETAGTIIDKIKSKT